MFFWLGSRSMYVRVWGSTFFMLRVFRVVIFSLYVCVCSPNEIYYKYFCAYTHIRTYISQFWNRIVPRAYFTIIISLFLYDPQSQGEKSEAELTTVHFTCVLENIIILIVYFSVVQRYHHPQETKFYIIILLTHIFYCHYVAHIFI